MTQKNEVKCDNISPNVAQVAPSVRATNEPKPVLTTATVPLEQAYNDSAAITLY